MSVAGEVEVYARSLGVWRSRGQVVFRRDEPRPDRLHCLAITREGAVFLVHHWDLGAPVKVDAPTALLLLLGHARGIVLDVGPCRECDGRTEERWSALTRPKGRGWKRWNSDTWVRPCPACVVDGQPTGRDRRPWERALLDAMPRPCSCGTGISSAPITFRTREEGREWARQNGYEPSLIQRDDSALGWIEGRPLTEADPTPAGPWVFADGDGPPLRWRDVPGDPRPPCEACDGTKLQPGDQTVRSALTAWSGARDLARLDALRPWDDATPNDTLAVWHDDALTRGLLSDDPSLALADPRAPWQVATDDDGRRWTNAAPVGLAEHPTLARLTAAWLAACNECRLVDHIQPCPDCGGTGTALGREIVERSAEIASYFLT